MKNHRRCPGCHRRHKPAHEKRVGTKKQYTPGCRVDQHRANRSKGILNIFKEKK